jgi:flagellar hook protein FlgE
MASTTSLLTGLSGLVANSRRLDVIGNNISNVNTTAFKSNRMHFAPAFSRNISLGTAPGSTTGGTNPAQVGLGVTVAGTQRNFATGPISPTGIPTDLAIDGDGFFVVQRAGREFYTRAGAFQLNSGNEMVTISGERVRGYAIDDNFTLVTGQAADISIPIGSLTIAEATENVNFAGNLNASGPLPTTGSSTVINEVWQDTGGTALTLGSTMGTLEDPANPGTPLFPGAGAPFVFTLSGVQKGDKTLPDSSLTIDPAVTTVQDVFDFINASLGINPGVVNPDGSTTGAQIDALGNVSIVGNTGSFNSIQLDAGDISFADNAGAIATNPFSITTAVEADGESIRTTFIAYDSLGTPLEVDLTLTLESTSDAGTFWRYYAESPDHIDPLMPSRLVTTGTLQFDNFGRLQTTAPISISLGRDQTGAVDPLDFTLTLNSGSDSVTALTDTSDQSAIAAVNQDGSPLGVLDSFSVGEDGVITGGFSNGLTRTIGQIIISTFTNPEGLIDAGNNLFAVGPNSGTALITTPGNFGTGRMIGGALEQSNVDLGQEFINLVLTQTGYSAATRVIQTTDELIQQLLVLGR